MTQQTPDAPATIRDRIANHLALIDAGFETEQEAVGFIAQYAIRSRSHARGAELIATERERQIADEGFDEAHDRGHEDELALAACAYATRDGGVSVDMGQAVHLRLDLGDALWPWDEQSWKPTPDDRVRELTKAGALIAASIDAILAEQQRDVEETPEPEVASA